MFSRALVGAALVAALRRALPTAAAAPLSVAGLTVNRQVEPLGLGDGRPFARLDAPGDGRGRAQSAYQVIVSKDGTDVWDSGEVHSPASANGLLRWTGAGFRARGYSWKVRAWDESGQPSAYSAPASLETGLLTAQGLDGRSGSAPPRTISSFFGARWIWSTNDDGANNLPVMTRYLRATVNLGECADRRPLPLHRRRRGRRLGQRHQVVDTKALRDSDENAWQKAQRSTSRACCTPAPTRSPCRSRTASTRAAARRPRASSAACAPARPRSTRQRVEDVHHRPGRLGAARVRRLRMDARACTATYGSGPWGSNVSLPPQPSPYLRKDFTAAGPIASARLYVSALGLYEVHINGRKVGDRCSRRAGRSTRSASRRRPTTSRTSSSPGQRDRRRARRRLVRRPPPGRAQVGQHARAARPAEADLRRRHDAPDRHRRQLAGRPRRAAGDEHLRRRDLRRAARPARLGQPGFDGGWSSAIVRTDSPAVEPSQAPPIRCIQTIKPVKLTQPTPGTYDLRPRPELRRLGAAARPGAGGHEGRACASARSSTATARSTPPTCARAQQTDSYTLRGTGATETYEPRFTYHGFRYVEVTGFPGTPALDSLDGREVSSDLPAYGTFTSRNAARELDPERDPLGAALELPRRPERLPLSATSASAGPGTSRPSPRPARSTATPPAISGSGCRRCATRNRAAGAFPDVAPVTCCGEGTAGWGDAGTVVPWAH